MSPDEAIAIVKPFNDIAHLAELEHEVVRLQHKVIRLQQEVDLWMGRCAGAEDEAALWKDRRESEKEAHAATLAWIKENMTEGDR